MRKFIVVLLALMLMLAAPSSQASPLLPAGTLAGAADDVVPVHHRVWHKKKKPDRGLHKGWTIGKHKGWSKGKGR